MMMEVLNLVRILFLCSFALFSFCGAVTAVQQPLQQPPNFVIILADDLGYGDLSVYAKTSIRTPHLDDMAAQGVKLTNFYAGAATCTPSRAALLTGRYPLRSGLIRVLHPRERFGLPDSELTLAELLKEQAYATACVGKWHLGDLPRFRPTRHGFDYFYGLLYSNDMTLRPPNFSRLWLWQNNEAIESPVVQQTLTKRYTKEAITFMEKNKTRPFFLYLAHTMPHVPLHASAEFRNRSTRGLYGDVVEEIDWSVGEIVKALQRMGLAERSLVVFTSDNGPAIERGAFGGSAGALRGGKQTVWEGGVRVPFIACWPGRLPAGSIRHGVATAMDLFPTLAELAGARNLKDRSIDGRSIINMLVGKQESPHSNVYCFLGKNLAAIRSGPWKLHLFKSELQLNGLRKPVPCDPPELYNLDDDPSERRNVSKTNPALVKQLSVQAQQFEITIVPGQLLPSWRGPF